MEHSIYKKINGSDKAPFSKRLVSGMMFRRQSNQSAHAGVEISQREEEGGGNGGGRKAQSPPLSLLPHPVMYLCSLFAQG